MFDKRRNGAAYCSSSALSRYAIMRVASPVRLLISLIVIRRCSTSSINRWTSVYVHEFHHFDISSNFGGSNGGKIIARVKYCMDIQFIAE
ncbi:hypothetical protein WK41_06290 [Burkholderia cepacia]|nr:hypothetical protein WK41_06290 [Burkholderia cepacia]